MTGTDPRPSKIKTILLCCLAASFVAALCAQAIIPQLYPREATVPLPLSSLVPKSVPGWQVEDLPLAETEHLQATVSKILRYDDTLHRNFSKGSANFSIYISYWLPGKVSYYDAGVHTPDTCWVYNGWEPQSRTHAVPLVIGNSRASKPAEVGSFAKNHTVLHVAFWHLVGGEVITYEQYGWNEGLKGHLERFPNYVRDLFRFGFNQGQEQSFVRISANRPIEQLIRDPEIAAILDTMSPLGLFAIPSAPDSTGR